MNNFTPKRDSWHYALVYSKTVSLVGYEKAQQALPKNFCTYWRFAITGLIYNSLLYVIAVFFFALLFVGVPFLGTLDSDISFWLSFLYTLVAYLGITLFIIVGVLVVIVGEKIGNFIKGKKAEALLNQDQSSSNLLITKWKSLKSKICPAVEYEE